MEEGKTILGAEGECSRRILNEP